MPVSGIRLQLEKLGVKWGKIMECPACHAHKLTASSTRNIATCWGCKKKWWPGMKHAYKVSWATTVCRYIAAKSQDHLETDTETLEYLTVTRKLGKNYDWYLAHHLGSYQTFDPAKIIDKAKVVLEKDLENALAASLDDDNRKATTAQFEVEREILETFIEDKLKPFAANSFLNRALVMIYTNAHGDALSLNMRQWRGEEAGNKKKFINRLQPIPGRRGVFNPSTHTGPWWDDKLPVIIVEGEFNWLSLQAQTERWQEPATKHTHPTGFEWMNELDAEPRFALSGMAVGGKEGADLQTIRGVLNHEAPLVLYDNDAVDPDTGAPRGYTLVEAVNLATPIWYNTTPCKDTDDWVKQHNPKPADLLELSEEATYLARPYPALADDIAKARKTPGADYAKVKAASEVLWEDLLTRCLIYNAGGEGTLVTREPVDNEVFHVRPDSPTWLDLMLRCGLESSDELCTKLGENITTRIQTSDAAIKIDHLPVLSHYNVETRTMYVDELDRVLRINRNGNIDIIRNGDDGVIFAPAGDARHADIDMRPGELLVYDGLFTKHILNCVKWDTTKGISEDCAKQLYKTHVLSIFFDTLMRDKAVPIFEGPAGGGKNTLTQMTGMLFEGQKFNVNPIPSSGKELDEQTVECIYAGFDEFDSHDSEMERAFRSWCTRQWAERRELYTTFGKARRALARGMGLSTNNNPAKDAATGTRQLMLSVAARQTSYDDKAFQGQGMVLIPRFMKVRNTIWSELIADLCRMVEALGSRNSWDKERTGFRMGDFGQLMLICADSEGWMDEADDMLRQMAGVQTQQMGERNLFVRLLTDYLLANRTEEVQYHTQSWWVNTLQDNIPNADKKAKQILNNDYARRMLVGSEKPILLTRFEVHEGTQQNGLWDKHKKLKTYAFRMRDRTAIDAGATSATPTFVVAEVQEE